MYCRCVIFIGFLIGILLGLPLATHAQDSLRQKSRFIQGRVVDAETGQPLPFAMLRLRLVPIGTVANEDGDFSFHFPAQYAPDSLLVSMMGYKRYTLSLATLTDSAQLSIQMAQNPISLPEVVVWGTESADARGFMLLAIKQIAKNYPQNPYLLHAFFRDVKAENGRYVSLLEAAVQIYDRNFDRAPRIPKKLLERVAIEELRRSYSYLDNAAWKALLNRENSLTELLSSNFLRYQYGVFDPKLPYTYEHETDLMLDGRLVYVLSVKEFPNTEIYLDAASMAVVRFRYTTLGNSAVETVTDSLHRRTKATALDFAFQEFQGRYFLKYMRSHTEYEDFDPRTGKTLHTATLKLDLLVNKVEMEENSRPRLAKSMNKYKSLDEHDAGRYNETFWRNYNALKETPLDSQLIQDLERDLPLKQQFQEN